jgi:hypothetical protein
VRIVDYQSAGRRGRNGGKSADLCVSAEKVVGIFTAECGVGAEYGGRARILCANGETGIVLRGARKAAWCLRGDGEGANDVGGGDEDDGKNAGHCEEQTRGSFIRG